MKKIIILIVILLLIISIYITYKIPNPIGKISLISLIIVGVIFQFVKVGKIKTVLISIFLLISVIFCVEGMLEDYHNNLNRKEFSKDLLVHFEKTSFQDCLKKAKNENKMVFLDIYTAWCGPCKVFTTFTLQDPIVAKEMNNTFVNFKVDAEIGDGIDIGKKYVKMGYPTLLVLDGDGKVIEDLSTGMVPGIIEMRQIIKKYK